MSVLQLKNLRYRWPGATEDTLHIEDLSLDPGKRLFLHGPSGCGKSTLLSAIAGVVRLPRDTVFVSDRDVGALQGGVRDRFRVDHIGLVFQIFNLVPWLSALDNILLPCRFSARRRERAGPDPAETARRLMRELGLDQRAVVTAPATSLSVGQQQRVAAARALIGKPELILADEPTSALDDGSKEKFIDLLARECAEAGTALLLVSHDRTLEPLFDSALDFRDLNKVAA